MLHLRGCQAEERAGPARARAKRAARRLIPDRWHFLPVLRGEIPLEGRNSLHSNTSCAAEGRASRDDPRRGGPGLAARPAAVQLARAPLRPVYTPKEYAIPTVPGPAWAPTTGLAGLMSDSTGPKRFSAVARSARASSSAAA